MTGPEEERAERVLRAVLHERAAGRTAPAALADMVQGRHRRRRRAVVTAAAAAVVVVGVGVPAGLIRSTAAPAPAAGPAPVRTLAPCVPTLGEKLPAPVPADRLPAQTGVRGSLGGDRALVDAAAVAGWQGLRIRSASKPVGNRNLAEPVVAGTVRVVFVERAGPGTLALVTAADRAGRWQAAEWVVGAGRKLVPTGGPGGVVSPGTFDRDNGQLYWGPDPLFISAQQVCGLTYGVVLAPPDATATIAGVPHIGSDGRPVPGSTRPLPLTGGLAVVPAQKQSSLATVTVSRGGTVLGTQAFNSEGSYASDAPAEATGPTAAQIAAAVRDSPRPVSAELLAEVAGHSGMELARRTSDRVTGVRVVWAGTWIGGRPGVLSAVRLPSGADYLTFGWTVSAGGYSMDFVGLLPAGRLDRTVFTWRSGRALSVVDPRATRAEAALDNGETVPVPLTGGAGRVAVPGHAKVTDVRTYDSGGVLLGHGVPGSVLLDLPG